MKHFCKWLLKENEIPVDQHPVPLDSIKTAIVPPELPALKKENVIQYLHRQEIDSERWDDCVQNGQPDLPYGFTWYLDIVCPGWCGLVKGDYEAVMPLPVTRKAGIRYSYQPPFSQQLGIWKKSPLEERHTTNFLAAIPPKLRVLDLHLHALPPQVERNKLSWAPRTNFCLTLNHSYEHLYKSYTKNRQRDLAKAHQHELTISHKLEVDTLLGVYRDNVGAGIGQSECNILTHLMPEAIKRNHGCTISVLDQNDQLHAAGFFVQNKHRLINLFPVTTADGRKSGAGTLLYDYLIRSHEYSNMVLDFEGSMIPTVAKFYQSFGATEEQYWRIRRNLLIWPLKMAYWLHRWKKDR